MSQIAETGIPLYKDPMTALELDQAFRRAHKRVKTFQHDEDTSAFLLDAAKDRQKEILDHIERLDPVWAQMMREAYGVE